MKSFSELVKAYYDWQRENDIDNNSNEGVNYIWELPRDAVEQWKTELEKDKYLFRDEVYQNYLHQFDEGGTLLGINNILHDDSNMVKLYKLTEYKERFIIERILVSKTQRLPIRGSEVELPDKRKIELPITVKYGSIVLDEPYDLKDKKISYNHGTLVGEGFKRELRDSNIINDNSLLATINYHTGEIHIIRNNDENEDKFIKNAQSSFSTSSGIPIPRLPYEYLTVSGSFITLGDPVELVFSFDCTGDSSLSSLKDSINSILVNQNNYIKQYINNYDYDLGIRTTE